MAQRGERHEQGQGVKSRTATLPKLADLGISKTQSSRWQQLAALDTAIFEQKTARAKYKAISTVDGTAKEVARQAERERYRARTNVGSNVEDLHALITAGQRFAVIYADPPWQFHTYSGEGKLRSADRHYDTIGLAEIARLPVAQLAAENCALLLWAVWPELPGALQVIKAWGFEFKTCGFLWTKQNRNGDGLFTGMGYWTRANSEPCLLATRGAPTRLAMDVHQVVNAPVAEHSRKPDEVRTRIERLLPGPYLELFARQPIQGWATWGNELPVGAFLALLGLWTLALVTLAR